jgi:hypothetical protein
MMLFEDNKFKVVDIDFSHKPPKVETNPKQCLACHGDKGGNVIPLWNQFPDWHNAFGSFVDRLSPEELQALEALKKKSASSNSRYSFLNFESKFPKFPYEVPADPATSNGNTGLTQRLNDRYGDFLKARVSKNYSSEPSVALNLKRALLIEAYCKPRLADMKSGSKDAKSSQEEMSYYAAFVRDPDGHNIEAVFRE